MLTGARVADREAAKQLLERLPAARVLHGDKGYDTTSSADELRPAAP
jgi:IS5 family transposase